MVFFIRTLDIAPLCEWSPQINSGMVRVLKGSQFFLHTHKFNPQSNCLTDPGGMEGWVGMVFGERVEISLSENEKKHEKPVMRLVWQRCKEILGGRRITRQPSVRSVQITLTLVDVQLLVYRPCVAQLTDRVTREPSYSLIHNVTPLQTRRSYEDEVVRNFTAAFTACLHALRCWSKYLPPEQI